MPRTVSADQWWRRLSRAQRLALTAAVVGVLAMALGSAFTASLLAQAQDGNGEHTLPWVWRDVTIMSVVGIGAVLLVFPPLARRLAHERSGHEAAQRALIEAKAFADALLDGMDAGLITLDARSQELTLNQVARRMHGLPDDAAVGEFRQQISTSLRAPGAREPLPPAERPLNRALAGERCELRLVISPVDGGAPVDVMVRARPIRDASGSVIAAASVVHDITDQLERERTLAEHATHIAALGTATRAVLREEDARSAVCAAAASVSGAALVSLFEPDGHGSLVCTASAGLDLLAMRMPLNGRSQVAGSFNAARTVFVHDVRTEAELDRATVARLESLLGVGIAAAVYTPVVVAGRSTAVLVTAFTAGKGSPSDSVAMLEVLATEAGVAIERADLLRQLHEQAVTDPLTGLGNRRAWLDGLARETARSDRNGAALGVAMLDLDHFKAYNDAHGHPAGDALLSEVAAAWRERLRGGDVICRVGGEEFGLLLPGCPVGAIEEVVENLRALVPRGLTVSAGTTVWLPGEDPMSTVSRADSLLYEAKDTGRDRQVFRIVSGALRAASPAAGLHVVEQGRT